MKYRLIVLACLILAGLTGLVARPSTAVFANGNSDAAHSCQHGGYAVQIGTDGTTDTTFTYTGGCVSYAAHGGILVSVAAAQPCLDGGYKGLTTDGGTVPFASEAACVLFVARGGTPVPVVTAPTLSGSISGASDAVAGACALVVHGSGLAAGTGVMLNPSAGNAITLVEVDGKTPVTVTPNGTIDLVTYAFPGFTISLSATTAAGASITSASFSTNC